MKFVHRAAAACTARSVAAVKVAASMGADGILSGTDYCDNRRPLMGPRLFFVRHTDDCEWPILDDFVAAGAVSSLSLD